MGNINRERVIPKRILSNIVHKLQMVNWMKMLLHVNANVSINKDWKNMLARYAPSSVRGRSACNISSMADINNVNFTFIDVTSY